MVHTFMYLSSEIVESRLQLCSTPISGATVKSRNKKHTRRWDSERELCLRRHRTRTTKYNRLVHKFRHRSTQLCVGTYVYQIQWNSAM